MSIHQKLIALTVLAGLVHMAIFPNTSIGAVVTVASLVLYAFTLAESVLIKRQDDALLERIKTLEEKMSSLMLSRGMGR